VRYSTGAKLLLAALLAGSLAIKAAFAGDLPPPDRALFGARADALLRASGFETRRRDHPLGVIAYGEMAGCRIMLAEYDPGGGNANILAIFAGPIGPLSYAWRGERLAAPPKLAPLTEHLVQRQLWHFGLKPARHPIVAIASSRGCPLDRIAWPSLGALPQ
jgi:hypothetical protein